MSEHATFFNGISWVCPPTASLPAPNRSFVTCRLKLRKRHFGSDGGGGAREEGKAAAAKANVTTDLSTTVTAIDDARRAVIYCCCCALCYGRHAFPVMSSATLPPKRLNIRVGRNGTCSRVLSMSVPTGRVHSAPGSELLRPLGHLKHPPSDRPSNSLLPSLHRH